MKEIKRVLLMCEHRFYRSGISSDRRVTISIASRVDTSYFLRGWHCIKKHTLFPKDIYRDPICKPHRQTDRHNEGRASVNMFSFRMTKNTWVYWREHPSHSPEENVHSHHGQGTRSRTLPDQNGLHSDHIRLPRPESPCNLPSLGLPAPLRGRTVIVLTPKRPQP